MNINAWTPGRPKKCAQCVQCAQCGPPITALRTEQDWLLPFDGEIKMYIKACRTVRSPWSANSVSPTAPSTNGVGSPRREPFRIVLQNFLQAWYPSKGFYIFTLYTIWPIYTQRTLPGPDPAIGLLSSGNSCVDRRTSDDSIASRGKKYSF